MEENRNLQAWISFALDAIADLGHEIWFVSLHRPDDFTALDEWVSVREEFPGCAARWILYRKVGEKWLRQAA